LPVERASGRKERDGTKGKGIGEEPVHGGRGADQRAADGGCVRRAIWPAAAPCDGGRARPAVKVFGAAETAAALPFPALMAALRATFAAGTAEVPDRHAHALPGGATLLLKPAWDSTWLGTKVVTVHPANARAGLPAVHALYVLQEAATGRPAAVLDGDELTARRTAAVSALAASFLAPAGAARMLLCGAGRVGRLLPPAMRSALPGLSHVDVWSPSGASAEALARELDSSGLRAAAVRDLEAAARRADVLSCATLAREPLIRGDWLRPGQHLDLVGAFTPDMREADAEAVGRAAVFADTEAAIGTCGELPTGAPVRGTLAALCRGEAGRGGTDEVMLFKSVGTALADLAAASLAVGGGTAPAR
jgi:ornithine cyclodeaminase/alanine dehydrogenase-like protein (mu-crystallin family)